MLYDSLLQQRKNLYIPNPNDDRYTWAWLPRPSIQPSEKAMSLTGMQAKSHRLVELIRPRWLLQSSGSTEQGLTLLECLMAVVVMGLTIGIVLPPLFIASATRVQTRRAEQALQIAQGEVDRIRSLVVLDRHFSSSLPATTGTAIESTPAPTKVSSQVKTSSSGSCTPYTGTQLPINTALLVDIDADCQPDFLMQVFRTSGTLSTSQSSEAAGDQRPSQFDLGVRVYSILARNSLGSLETQQASLGLTNGQGNQLKRPLATLYTGISWSDQDGTLCGYQKGNSNGTIESCQNF